MADIASVSVDSRYGFLQLKPCLVNPSEIWLDWLKDEIRLTDEEPNREKVYELFERAIKDYICECTCHCLYFKSFF